MTTKIKNTIIFVSFLVYSITIFCFTNYIFIIVGTSIQMLLIYIFKIKISSSFDNIKICLPFCIMVFIFNYLFSRDFIHCLILSYKIILICNATFIMSKILSFSQLSEVICFLLTALKIFKYNIEEIAITISISLNFIPIMIDQLGEIRKSLLSKNFHFSLKNFIRRPDVFLITYLNSIFYKIDEMEKSMVSKLYE